MWSYTVDFVEQLPTLMRILVFVAVFGLATGLIGGAVKLIGDYRAKRAKPNVRQTQQAANQRTGWRSRGDRVSGGSVRISNQDVGIDSENSDWEEGDIDIK